MRPLHTPLCDLLRIRYPIIQAPIGSATTADLAAAASEAGALGMLAISWRDLGEIQEVIHATGRLTSQPFGVNVVLEWAQEDRVDAALELGVRIISSAWGDPSWCVRRVHDAGGLVLHSVGSVDEAMTVVAAGVDVIVAQGVEAGGHVRGTTPTRKLLEQIIQRVPDVPIIATGGVGSGRNVAELLAAGASGVALGTVFLASHEANVAAEYRQAVLAASASDTALTTLFDKGWPNAAHRVIRNSTVRLWEGAGCPESGRRPGEDDVVAWRRDGTGIVRYSDTLPTRGLVGNLEALALYAGQSVDCVNAVRPAQEIIAELVREAIPLWERTQEVWP